MITYEYPFNERIRTLLRLEDLFERTSYFVDQQGSREHHVALLSMFEILEVAGRADLKMDLIQELERQRQTLLVYRNNPDISEEALSYESIRKDFNRHKRRIAEKLKIPV